MTSKIIIYGINSITIQTLILREIISIFYSNELFVSLSIFGWLISSILGVMFAEKAINRESFTKKLIIIYHITAPLTGLFSIIFIRKIKIIFFPLGENPDFFICVAISFLSSFICSFINGVYYSLASPKNSDDGYVKTYYLESIGYAIGGILIYHLLINSNFSIFTIFFTLLAINIITIYRIKLLFFFFLTLNMLTIFYFQKNYALYENPKRKITEHLDSPYSKIEVSKIGDDVIIYSNSYSISSTMKRFMTEKMVFIPVYYNGKPQKAAVLTPNAGLIKELADYKTEQIYVIEKDEKLAKTVLRYMRNIKNNISISNPKNFFQNQKDLDIIILPPGFTQNSYYGYFYSIEFLEILKKSLSEKGCVVAPIPLASYITEPAGTKILQIIKHNIKSVFNYAYEYQDEETLIVAYKKMLDSQNKKIGNNLIKKEYINYIIEKEIKIEDKKSQSLTNPGLFAYGTLHELSKHYPGISAMITNNTNKLFIIIFSLIITLLWLIFLKEPKISLISASAFFFTFIEVISIFLINNKYGSIYTDIQHIIISAMIGLALGAIIQKERSPSLFVIFLPLLISILLFHNKYMLYLITFIAGFLNGNLFSGLTRTTNKNKYKVYVYDMIGGALGMLIVPFFIIGLGGIYAGIFIAIIINIMILFYIRFVSKII